MLRPFETINEFLARKPFLVGCFLIIILAFAIIGAMGISMEAEGINSSDFSSHASYVSDSYDRHFSSDSIILMVQADSVTDTNIVERIYALERQWESYDGVNTVVGLYDIIAAANGGLIPVNQASVNSIVASLPTDTLTSLMPNGELTLIVISVDSGLSSDKVQSLLMNLESSLSIADIPPGVTLTFTGNSAMMRDMSKSIGADMITLLVAAIILMIIACRVLFNHVRNPLLPVICVSIGLLLTFGVMGLVGLPMSMVTIGALPILLGIGVDYGIQFHSRLDDEVRVHPLPTAIKLTITKTGSAVFFAMCASAIGFLAMQVSRMESIRQFGYVAMIGIACCYLSALLIIPLYALITNYTPKPHTPSSYSSSTTTFSERYNAFLGKMAVKIAKYAVPILLILCIVGVTGLFLDEEVPIQTDTKSYLPNDMPAIVNLNMMSRAMGDTGGFPVYVQGDSLTSPETIEWMYDWGNHELALYDTRFTSVSSIATVIVHANNGVLPTTQTEVDRILDSMEDAAVSSYLLDNSQAVIRFGMVSLSEPQQRSLLESVTADINFYPPPIGVEALVTGTPYTYVNTMDDIMGGKSQMTLLAFVLIFVFLALLYRSWRKALCPIIPIILIIGWNGAAMYLFDIEYTVLTATMGAMTIGVAAEYCIMMVERIYEEMEVCDTETAVEHGTSKIGTAITVSGCATMCGFSALLFANFPLIQDFGLVTVLAMAFTLFGALVAVPALVSLILKNSEKTTADVGHTSPSL
ncbi:hydrophobe/amphiphile efflux-3 (HAE3) family transporter [Methanorbis furvi]|uniref:SSD domain-containing protein n=1 Tax=Methanorbis furvi TaxID=3028299 RepID=A0AAE4SCG8_9EURY|nr:hypothetical protein [Methanocorpusculaceae archaeon Ag1]